MPAPNEAAYHRVLTRALFERGYRDRLIDSNVTEGHFDRTESALDLENVDPAGLSATLPAGFTAQQLVSLRNAIEEMRNAPNSQDPLIRNAITTLHGATGADQMQTLKVIGRGLFDPVFGAQLCDPNPHVLGEALQTVGVTVTGNALTSLSNAFLAIDRSKLEAVAAAFGHQLLS